MRRKTNRKKVDTLYVLGAGASYALSNVNRKTKNHVKQVTPLDRNFLRSLEAAKPNIGWRRVSTELIFNDWLDSSDICGNGLEQAIIRRVSQYDFLSKFHPTRVGKKVTNEDYLNHLSHLICEYLKACKSNSSGKTKTFINHTFPVGVPVEEYSNRIITFNYDTLIERPLMERGISTKKIYFDRIVKKRELGTRRDADEKFDAPLILKLHGSTNWRCVRKHFDSLISGDIAADEKITIWQSDKTSKPDDGDSPLIIPPIPNKPITRSSIFNFLWGRAYEYMHEAKRIVIVGYSCPPTDTLARTMFGHFTSNSLQEIFVVDPDATALKSYRDMLEPKLAAKIKWRYYSDFAEYIHGELK